MKEKTVLFIDGSNMYAGQYALFGPKKYLDFSKFIKELENKLQFTFHSIFFYASFSPQSNSQKYQQYLKNESFFYKSVKNEKRIVFFKGYRSPTSGKEKEVDVKLTADLVHLAHTNYYKNVFLLSGDADFLQALHLINELDKNINIISLSNKIMHRAAYYYTTFIVSFKDTLKSIRKNRHKKQKIHIIMVSNGCIVNVDKKNPDMQACQAG